MIGTFTAGRETAADRGSSLGDELAAMDRALELARRGPSGGPNPRVGCVILAAPARTATPPSTPPATPAGPLAPVTPTPRRVLAEGWHRGAGTLHAEAAALAAARANGIDVRGATAVVTLEPCHHTGRTPPCAQALIDAGVARVVVAVADPNPAAAGGGDQLRAAGVDVASGVREAEGRELLRIWLAAVERGRPYVTLKLASSLDGRVAAADGSSRWITSDVAREHAHRLRAEVGAIAVGTGTVCADDPELTARTASSELTSHQPLRVVVGLRDVPAGARVRGPGGELLHLRTHDVASVLAALHAREVRHLLVEGGPTLAAAFLRAGVVDEIHAYIAPVLLGAGPSAVGDLGITSIGDALRYEPREPIALGPDVLIVSTPVRATSGAAPPLPSPEPSPHAPTPPAPTEQET